MSEAQKRIMRVFKSRIPSCKYHFQNGKEANFKHGEYLTEDKKEIEELEAEITARHPHIYIDANKVEVDVNEDPMATLRAKIAAEERAKVLAEMSAAGGVVAGNEVTKAPTDIVAKLQAMKTGGIASTSTVAAVTGDSNTK